MIAATLSLMLLPASAVLAADPALRTVRGPIVAINAAAAPPTIVIRTRTPKNDEMIVGATVDDRTQVMRGAEAIPLGDLKEGETVTLRYLKTDNGLVARLIRAE